MKIWVVFPTLNRYQHARIAAARKAGLQVGVIEVSKLGSYPIPGWRAPEADQMPDVVSLFHDRFAGEVSSVDLRRGLHAKLDAKRDEIDVLAVLGWGNREALSALDWANTNRIPVVAFSDSHTIFKRRALLKELPKRQIVGLFSSALVAGQPHREYIGSLGIPQSAIFEGFNIVDNDLFSIRSKEIKALGVPSGVREHLARPFFLCSARFIWEKNLPRFFQAYARYRTLCGQHPESPLSLVLVGDGILRPELEKLRAELHLENTLHFEGYKRFDDLPAYYGMASAIILPSISETWGLVVNEAMASGLPVLVSNRCGCAADLVQEGVNGFTFDPYDVEQMAQLMVRVASGEPGARSGEKGEGNGGKEPTTLNLQPSTTLAEMGAASQRIIADWGPERFASGLKAAAECAVKIGPKRASLVQRLILKALLSR